jgi:hypothetical protein
MNEAKKTSHERPAVIQQPNKKHRSQYGSNATPKKYSLLTDGMLIRNLYR